MYIEPGSPWENGYCESFNSNMHDEFLNGEIFYPIKELRVLAKRGLKIDWCAKTLRRTAGTLNPLAFESVSIVQSATPPSPSQGSGCQATHLKPQPIRPGYEAFYFLNLVSLDRAAWSRGRMPAPRGSSRVSRWGEWFIGSPATSSTPSGSSTVSRKS